MVIVYLFVIVIVSTCLSNVYGIDYEDEEKMYQLVSPDQHTRTPRLEDFFWTGSGDGPPPPDLSAPLPSPTAPVVRTTTVLATVYLDSYPPQAVTDKTSGECVLNCEATPDSLEPEIPEDRRYWLLTVIQGSTPDSLQLRLARLYQKAFLRQQERHLGIIKSLDAPTPRKKHDVHSFVINKDNEFKEINTNTAKTPQKFYDNQTFISLDDLSVNNDKHRSQNASMNNSYLANIEMFSIDQDESPVDPIKIKSNKVETWILVTPTVVVHKREVEEVIESNKEDLIDLPLEEEVSNETLLFKREIIKPDQQPPVQVHIQNITESTEGSVQIVYVVLVGGRAVPAAVAARDMRLVRDAEVAKELGAVVTTKAEPYLKAAEGLEGEAGTIGVHGTELWALAVGSTVAILLLLVLLALLCFAHKKKNAKSAASLRAYRNELLREAERQQMKQISDEKDSKLISVVSPSRTRPSSVLLPIYRTGSASGSSTTSSGISEVAAALRRRQKKPHALRMPQKKRVGTTDSLLEAAGLDSSDSGQPSPLGPPTPTSYLSMPSVNAFPRGNIVEPLSKILEPVSVRHLDIDSSPTSLDQSKVVKPMSGKDVVPRRQMPSQLVRLGSIDKDPGVIGPLVWDLHCQRIKDVSKPSSPAKSASSSARKEPGASRMRQRFNELMDDAFTLFGSAASSDSHHTFTVVKQESKESRESAESVERKSEPVTQARNDNVRLPGSPYTALHVVRGRSAGPGRSSATTDSGSSRPRTALMRGATGERRAPPTPAWPSAPAHRHPTPIVSPAIITAEGRLAPDDPALPLISAIKSEIQRVREDAKKSAFQHRE
ncbi:uncharacterized protein LOC112051089 isoform X2 [Bicyclus anynana]|uniref:Uncharacterized protein LOC112051089 isoform X2 n=1 Tax=Bicyclus anynana TaxID=110368 RepID=A0A6J1NK18_BICAN|nr:uncharacterized protein LOC112051089 isoform X2 [Bicyclus anynana]